jgi:hypothetical protein
MDETTVPSLILDTYTANVTQYIRPDGRSVAVTTELPAISRDAYLDMLEHGCRLEAEALVTGEVSVTVYDPETESDVDIELVSNGPGIQDEIAEMLNRRQWLKQRRKNANAAMVQKKKI